MKILLVAPGPRHSTYDVFQGYKNAMNRHEDVELYTYPYHSILDYHKAAQLMLMPYDMDEDILNSIAIARGSRELLADIAFYSPDVVLFIAATAYPIEMLQHIRRLQVNMAEQFAVGIYFTESPYLDELQKAFTPFADFVLTNEKTSIKTFDPEGKLYVDYLPHSYDPNVHNPQIDYSNIEDYERDVFFCGTPFYERQELLASVDWDGIDLALFGPWNKLHIKDKDIQDSLLQYAIKDFLPNEEVSRYYRHSRVSVNIHRTRPDLGNETEALDNRNIYSTGPRAFEVVASGGFLVTDYRQELYDLFGDNILYFDDSDSLNKAISSALSLPDGQRSSMMRNARKAIQNCTFDDRLNKVMYNIFEEVTKLRRKTNG